MEMPWRCRSCQRENMIDFESLSVWPVDKVVNAHGFQCEFCGNQEVVAYMTISLVEHFSKLLRYAPEHAKFAFLFKKALKKAEGVNRRGEIAYGTLRHKNMVAS